MAEFSKSFEKVFNFPAVFRLSDENKLSIEGNRSEILVKFQKFPP